MLTCLCGDFLGLESREKFGPEQRAVSVGKRFKRTFFMILIIRIIFLLRKIKASGDILSMQIGTVFNRNGA